MSFSNNLFPSRKFFCGRLLSFFMLIMLLQRFHLMPSYKLGIPYRHLVLSPRQFRPYASSNLVKRKLNNNDDRIIDVKIVSPPTDKEHENLQKAGERKSPLSKATDFAKSQISRLSDLFSEKKKEKDPTSQVINQAYDEIDRAFGSTNPLMNPLGALTRGVLKTALKQMGSIIQKASEQNAAAFGKIQKEALRLILLNNEIRSSFDLWGDSNDDKNTLYYDKNGNQIFLESSGESSKFSGESDWQSSPPISVVSNSMNFNGRSSQQIAFVYQLSSPKLSGESLLVQVQATLDNDMPNISQLIVSMPTRNMNIRIR